MTERTRKTGVYLALVAAIIWGAYNFLGKHNTVVVVAPATIQPAAASPAGSVVADQTLIAGRAEQPWGTDPFRIKQGESRSSGAPRWILTGIVFSDTSPLAYINRQAVREGDSIDNATVVKIDRRAVTLKYNGGELTIHVSRG